MEGKEHIDKRLCLELIMKLGISIGLTPNEMETIFVAGWNAIIVPKATWYGGFCKNEFQFWMDYTMEYNL